MIRKAAEDFGVTLDSAIRMRIRYLQSLLAAWNAYIDEQTDEIPESDVMAILGEMVAIRKYQDMMKSGVVLKGITDEQIQAAKTTPIENLIEFQKGAAIAWCHADRHPSLSWDKKRNRAKCWPCDKSFDSIQVCVDRDGMTFIEAVRFLCNNY